MNAGLDTAGIGYAGNPMGGLLAVFWMLGWSIAIIGGCKLAARVAKHINIALLLQGAVAVLSRLRRFLLRRGKDKE